jgi:hypothetical protein
MFASMPSIFERGKLFRLTFCLSLLLIAQTAFGQTPDPTTFDPATFDPNTFKATEFDATKFDPQTWNPDKLHGFLDKLKDPDLAVVMKKLGPAKATDTLSRASNGKVYELQNLSQPAYDEIKPAVLNGEVIVIRVQQTGFAGIAQFGLTGSFSKAFASASGRVRGYARRLSSATDVVKDWIDQGKDAVGGVLNTLTGGQLADVLTSLDPSKLAQRLGELKPEDLASVMKKLDPSQLGNVLDKLTPGDLGKTLDKLKPADLTDALAKLDPQKLASTLDRLAEAAVGSTGDLFNKLNGGQLFEVFKKVTPQGLVSALDKLKINDRIDNLTPILLRLDKLDLAKTFEKAGELPVGRLMAKMKLPRFKSILDRLSELDPARFQDQLAKIRWEMIVPTNIPWDQLPRGMDIRKLPWEKIDPTQVPWEKVDPSRVDWSKADPTPKARQAGGWFSDRAKEAGDQAKQLGDQVATVPGTAAEELGRAGAKLDESVRTNVGQAVAAVKDTPIYKRLVELLLPFTKIVLFDITNNITVDFNCKTGAYSFKFLAAPGIPITETNVESWLQDQGSIPTPEFDKLAFAALGYREQTTTNYKSIRGDLHKRYSGADVYLVSEDFVDFFSLENAAREGVKVFYTGDATTAARRGIKVLRKEADHIYAWLENHVDNKADEFFEEVAGAIFESALTGSDAPLKRISKVRVKLEPVIIVYKYEYKPSGMTKIAADLIAAGAEQLGIKLNKVGEDERSDWASLSFSINHPGFAIVWDDATPASGYLNKVAGEFDRKKQSHINDALSRAQVVDRIIAGVAAKSAELQKIKDMVSAATSPQAVEAALRDRLFSLLPVDQATIAEKLINGDPCVDLRGTKVERELMNKIRGLALGTEGRVTVDELTLNLNTYALTVRVSIRHREVMDIQGIFDALLDRFTGFVRKVAGAEPNQATRDEMTKAKDNYQREKQRVETAPDNGADSAKVTTRGKLLWHLTEPTAFQTFGADLYPGAEPVYYVSGMLTSLTDARGEASALSGRLRRPVNLIYNPSWLNTDTDPAVFPSVSPNQTGTPDQPTDLTEAVYDRTWPDFMTQYFNRLAAGGVNTKREVVGGLEEVVDVVGTPKSPGWRLQLNPTTRQVAHLLFHADRPVTIVSNNQGSIIVRNACHTLALLGKDQFVRSHVRWIDCGGVLAPSEIAPRPCCYTPLVHAEDLSGTYLGLKRKLNPTELARLTNPKQPGQLPGFGLSLYLEAFDPGTFPFCPPPCNPCRTVLPLAGDANGDKLDDVWFACVRAESCGTYLVESLACHLNAGPSGPTATPYFKLASPFGDVPGIPFVADFNGDGLADIALFIPCRVVTPSVRTTGGWLVRRNDGRGGFEELYYIQHVTEKNDIGWDPRWVRVGDVNGDGSADVVSYSPCLDEWGVQTVNKVFKKNADMKDVEVAAVFSDVIRGRFASAGRSSCPSNFQVADINGDGKADILLCRTFVSYTAFHRLCRGHFRPHTTMATELYLSGAGASNPSGVSFPNAPSAYLACCFDSRTVFGDWNGDHKADLCRVSARNCDLCGCDYQLTLSPWLNESDTGVGCYRFIPSQGTWCLRISCFSPPEGPVAVIGSTRVRLMRESTTLEPAR